MLWQPDRTRVLQGARARVWGGGGGGGGGDGRRDSRKVPPEIKCLGNTHVHVEEEGADVKDEKDNSPPIQSALALEALKFPHFIKKCWDLYRACWYVIIWHSSVLLLAWGGL